jgi:hypothetical protein
MRFAGSAVALTLALLPDVAPAQKGDAPQIKVGDRWQFVLHYGVPSTAPNLAWVVTSITPQRIEGTENGERLVMTPELNVLESPRSRSSNPQTLRFPLEVGKAWQYVSDWEFRAKGSRGRIDARVSVVAYEKVTVVAGQFDAFKLTASERLHGRSPINSVYDAETTRTYWYAPAAKAIVKLVSHNPYLGPSTIELVDFELRP